MAKLFFRYAAMNSGKSTQLLQIANNYESMGKAVALFTSAMDDRYGFGKITSRLNLQREARTFSPEMNFLAEDFGQTACILIDEAQFMTPEQVHQLHELAHTRNIPVICFGLRTDFRGEPFVGSGMLLALADEIEEIKTICECGKKATMHIRIDADGRRVKEGPQVEIGGNARYRAVCARCFYQL
ncbi:thymidine kinase [Chromobacterium alkanivorans]|uniref:thymidine kinase n=1 Tax=Chromobacterium alkanivorans TaxID=1071719 RepID=UPI00216938E9|nr:thymidine kinase [Chromobacterium alkanivorans]MCS3806433.1 thymidine kinase [Chromobacterium alkanivorans]MCS3820872.1 thymidine kinase [Chromobacterium alkanivorans]MCS3875794.1 thymidine kinase [Chromobacterium alkanivorans]